MIRKIILFLLITAILPAASSVEAQQPRKVPRIGVLFPGSPAAFTQRTEAFLQGMKELGYVEGKTITIEWRWAEDKVERMPDLATELVKLNLDMIVARSEEHTS